MRPFAFPAVGCLLPPASASARHDATVSRHPAAWARVPGRRRSGGPVSWVALVQGDAVQSQSASFERILATAWPWIWLTRDSVTPSTAPISFRFRSCS